MSTPKPRASVCSLCDAPPDATGGLYRQSPRTGRKFPADLALCLACYERESRRFWTDLAASIRSRGKIIERGAA